MATSGPTKTAVILATPIENVEESRAQRLQRQQARFRDRGGIFIPSSRNTLADILLGKAPPLKKRQRSVSASPTRRLSGTKQPRNIGDKSPNKAPRPSKTPQKDARKSTGGKKRQSIPTSQPKGKQSKKVELSDYSELEDAPLPQKPASARKSSSNKAPLQDDLLEDAIASTKLGKPSAKSSKAPPKSRQKKSKVIESESEHEPAPVPKKGKSKSKAPPTKPKSKAKSKSQFSKESDNASEDRDTVSSKKPPRKPVRRRSSSSKIETIYDMSESEEYIPPTKAKKTEPKKKPATSTTSISQTKPKPVPVAQPLSRLSDIPEEEEEEESPRLASKTSVKKPVDAPSKGKKRPANDDSSSSKPPPPKKSRSTKADSTNAKPSVKASSSSSQNGKVHADDDDSDNLEGISDSALKKKRTRTAEEEEVPDESSKRSGKRSRLEEEPPKKQKSDKKPLREKAKAPKNVLQDKTMTTKPPASESKKTPSVDVIKTVTAKRKENAVVAKQAQRGPPKSVLLKLKNSQPLVFDFDPDPIDFLS